MPESSQQHCSRIALAIETSQRAASVAVRDRNGVIHEEPLLPRKRHDDDLMPAIDRLFRRAALSVIDLQDGMVAVSIGPGGFTGLRIAIATAKMLAETRNVGLVAVPSALVAIEGVSLAKPSAITGDDAVVALACKGESFWHTSVRRDAIGGPWSVVGQPGLSSAPQLDDQVFQLIVADEFFPSSAREHAARLGVPIVEPIFQAKACLSVGEHLAAGGQLTDPLRLVPLYPRQPEAVVLWEQRHRKPG